ncbi:uncharacterized protein LOC135704774 [Ochlerotatus camptorhynchus]|uniref:uncharacterized protein LOC135704774 n=1 Tax=Ochlerotatus camptorhynchus TaxID=644619 RepID=UPI0031D65040
MSLLSSSSSRPRSLMEALLAKKIEAASQAGVPGSPNNNGGGPGGSRLIRTDSMDSSSSIGSLVLGEDVCRCDDCLLGIVDLYTIGPQETAYAKKKVSNKHKRARRERRA